MHGGAGVVSVQGGGGGVVVCAHGATVVPGSGSTALSSLVRAYTICWSTHFGSFNAVLGGSCTHTETGSSLSLESDGGIGCGG